MHTGFLAVPAVSQCPVLAAKCDCEARGDGGRGRDWAREASGLKGEEARPDRREGKKGLGGSRRAVRGATSRTPHPQDLEEWGGCLMSRREGLTPAGNHRYGWLRLCPARAQRGPGHFQEPGASVTSSQLRHGPGWGSTVGIARPCR